MIPELGPRTITDRRALRTEIEQVRQHGYATADEEHERGILAIGVPMLGSDGVAAAAISTAAPAPRSSMSELHEHLDPLREASRELAAGLPRR